MAEIKVYGAPWRPDCELSKKFLAEHRIPYDWIDIDDNAEGLRRGQGSPTTEIARA